MIQPEIGDKLTITGVCKGGVIDETAPPERLQQFVVVEEDVSGWRLNLIGAVNKRDKEVEAFNNAYGRYWLRKGE